MHIVTIRMTTAQEHDIAEALGRNQVKRATLNASAWFFNIYAMFRVPEINNNKKMVKKKKREGGMPS